MKYLKLFTESEVFTEEPKEGDYVITKLFYPNSAIDNFCHNNIGQIIGIIYGKFSLRTIYKVRYENVPSYIKLSHLNNNIRGFFKQDLELWYIDKVELQSMIDAKNYNL